MLTQLELDAPEIVTIADLAALVRGAGIGTEPKVVADRLRRYGWLLPTGIPGVWEFAPGSHAGAIGHGDPYLALRAALAGRPSLDAAVCLTSALAAHRLVDRAPDRLEVAGPAGASMPNGLRRCARLVVFHAQLPYDQSSGVPIHQLATILVHLAARPGDVRGWGAVAEALPELVDAVDRAAVDAELAPRPRSVSARLAYLVQGVAPSLADHLVPPEDGGRGAAKVWFGPRAHLVRHSSRFSVADTLLPFDPKSLGPVS